MGMYYMKLRKELEAPQPCVKCGKPSIYVAHGWEFGRQGNVMCHKCYHKEKYPDSYMTEADYQTWGRL
jgi:hypothetical protein